MKKWILFLCFFVISSFLLIGCSSDNKGVSKAESKGETVLEEIKVQANDVLKKDKEIAEFTIDSIEYSHENQDSHKQYMVWYSMKPSDPENFILAGSGVMGDGGWIKERVLYCTIKDDGKLIFSTSP